MFKKQSEIRAEQSALIDEYINGHKVVVALNHVEESKEDFDAVNAKLQKVSLKAVFFSSITNPTTRFVNNLVYAGVALFGALIVAFGGGAAITIGTLSVFLNYANQYTKPFNEISGVITELQNALICAGRLFEVLNATEMDKAKTEKKIENVQGAIEIKNLAFSYSPEKPLIENFNLSVTPGERIAIVGPTGCGKTTFINLLMRFYDANDGSIIIDGKNIFDVSRENLRKCWGMVLQDTWLRHASVRDNIKMAKPDATDEEIITAAKAAHAHSFIKRLPQGYDTILSENGDSLSAGQKQLLCISRLMLALPPMLILDEATSSIDTRMELKIQNAFSNLMKGRTTFIVAHRLSTIENADQILVMKDGKIIEQGNHKKLLAKNGFYHNLYYSQYAI